MNEYDCKQLDDFLTAIEPHLAGYKHATFSYLALKKGEVFELVQARLLLIGVPPTIVSKRFESENLRAEVFKLDEMKLSVKEVIESLLSGTLRTPRGELRFPPEQDRSHSTYYNPFHSDGIPMQQRQMQLHIRGNRRNRIESLQLDWELKAAAVPFESVQELCGEYAVGPTNGDYATVEIIAFNVAAVGAESRVKGTKANVVINLVNGLERDQASLGYRIIERNAVVKRGTISGAAMSWRNVGNYQQGETELEISAGAVLHCFACYGGRAQHHYWVADPSTAQNPLRAVHQTFDNKLDVLQELVTKAQTKGANARDLEIAIAWLLWMLGFSATHIGATPKTSDAPDLIATTPQGHFLVIECTTGILKEDNKLPHLVERTEKVRQSLAASGNQHLRVLPVIVTTKTREEVRAETDQAHKLGVLVATREVFAELLNRSLLFPDASRAYAEAEEALSRIQNPSVFPALEGLK